LLGLVLGCEEDDSLLLDPNSWVVSAGPGTSLPCLRS
jgi:hypothetical protein